MFYCDDEDAGIWFRRYGSLEQTTRKDIGMLDFTSELAGIDGIVSFIVGSLHGISLSSGGPLFTTGLPVRPVTSLLALVASWVD